MKNREVISFTHESGLGVDIGIMRGFTSKYASITVKTGSRCEEFPLGTAHFLEHKVFEEPETADGEILPDKLSELGADANAATSYATTTFYFTCTENFGEALKTLLDMVLFPDITEEATEREKEIIIREINTDKDSPDYISEQAMLLKAYPDDLIKEEIAGNEESISTITANTLLKAHRKYYVPENMVLSAAGDITEEDVRNAIDEVFGKYSSGNKSGREIANPPVVSRALAREKTGDELTKAYCSTENNVFFAGIRDDFWREKSGRELAEYTSACSALTELLFGTSSDFFRKAYEDGIIDGSFMVNYEFDVCHAIFTFEGNTDWPEELLRRIRETIKKAKTDGIEEGRVRRLAKAFGGAYAMDIDSPLGMGEMLTEGRLWGLFGFDYFNACVTIKSDKVNEAIETISGGDIKMAIANEQ